MKLHVVACWLCLVASGAQAATVQVFFDRQSFENAAATLTVETFNSFTSDSAFGAAPGPAPRTLQPLQVGPFSLSSQRAGSSNRIDVAELRNNGTLQLNSNRIDETPFVLVTETAGNNDFFIDFDDPIFAFGADVASYANSRTDILLGPSSEPLFRLDGDDPSNAITDFIGFISDVSFTQIAIVRDGGDSVFGLDNFAFSASSTTGSVTSATAIPLPPALPALLVGLGLFGVYARSRRLSR